MLLATGEQVTIALLAMAIHAEGYEAVSMTGAQAGIVSDSSHTKARIEEVRADRVAEALDEGSIVIVAGFQGLTPGRRDHDARPGRQRHDRRRRRGRPRRRRLRDLHGRRRRLHRRPAHRARTPARSTRISYEEMLETGRRRAPASCSCAASSSRATTASSSTCAPASTTTPAPSSRRPTRPWKRRSSPASPTTRREAKVTIRDVPDQPGVAAEVFGTLAEANVNVDMIIQNVSEEGTTDISFTTPKDDLPRARRAVAAVVEELGARDWSLDESIAKVSLVGAGMKTHPGVAAKMFRALADAGVNLDMISTSTIRITAVISAAEVEAGRARAAHRVRSRRRRGDRRGRSRPRRREVSEHDLGQGRCPRAPSSRSPAPPAPSASRC